MSEQQERDRWLRGALKEMDERMAALEARFEAVLETPPIIANFGELRGRIEAVEAWRLSDDRTDAARIRDERISYLEGKRAALAARVETLEERALERNVRIETLVERLESLFERITALELGADIAHQFAAARAGELQKLTERVAELEQWQGSCVLPEEQDG